MFFDLRVKFRVGAYYACMPSSAILAKLSHLFGQTIRNRSPSYQEDIPDSALAPHNCKAAQQLHTDVWML